MNSTLEFTRFVAHALTDEPVVVVLKREFRRLDEREETLKMQGEAGREELEVVRERKRGIAEKIFKSPPVRPFFCYQPGVV